MADFGLPLSQSQRPKSWEPDGYFSEQRPCRPCLVGRDISRCEPHPAAAAAHRRGIVDLIARDPEFEKPFQDSLALSVLQAEKRRRRSSEITMYLTRSQRTSTTGPYTYRSLPTETIHSTTLPHPRPPAPSQNRRHGTGVFVTPRFLPLPIVDGVAGGEPVTGIPSPFEAVDRQPKSRIESGKA